MDSEFVRLWHLISDLGDQLSHNQKITKTLLGQTNVLKAEAAEANSGFALRRANVDISKGKAWNRTRCIDLNANPPILQEFFESELERTNAQIVIENQTLKHENKQLSVLLKEYEGTLETIMVKFRNHSLAAQQHELTLARHYEALILAHQTQDISSDLASTANMTESLQRISRYLRDLLLAMASENIDLDPHLAEHEGFVDPAELLALIESSANPGDDSDSDSLHPEFEIRPDWAQERENDIARLEKENERLRKVLGIDSDTIAASGVDMEAELQRMNQGRHPELRDRRRDASGHLSVSGGGGDQWERSFSQMNINNQQMYMWDGPKNPGNSSNQPPLPPQYTQEIPLLGGAPLQRSMELATLRTSAQVAGSRIAQRFVQPQSQPNRGSWVSNPGRGGPPPSQSSTLWTNQQLSPSTQVTWPIQGGNAMDMGR
ncbi:hypothetical protein D9757_002237 [Collybiopsis confluens]|uniref:Uncharacterized protein n=1 Tax=Collybiopsis confluens TaxID=2823264 RepID=A0A8H5MFT9_9AGAR|nr:hypothetical protein D9757_002237 [Collybiopsis confluens]